MKGEQEIETMRAAGLPKRYFNASLPLLTLIQKLKKHNRVHYVHVQRGGESMVIQNRCSAYQVCV